MSVVGLVKDSNFFSKGGLFNRIYSPTGTVSKILSIILGLLKSHLMSSFPKHFSALSLCSRSCLSRRYGHLGMSRREWVTVHLVVDLWPGVDLGTGSSLHHSLFLLLRGPYVWFTTKWPHIHNGIDRNTPSSPFRVILGWGGGWAQTPSVCVYLEHWCCACFLVWVFIFPMASPFGVDTFIVDVCLSCGQSLYSGHTHLCTRGSFSWYLCLEASFPSFTNPVHRGLSSWEAATITLAHFLVCLSSRVFLLYTREAISTSNPPMFPNLSFLECESD